MMQQTMRGLLIAGGVATALFSTPADSHAFFHLFGHGCGLFGRSAYAPTYGYSGVCNPCAQQVVNYVPQVCYRTQYVTVPRTTFRPVTTYDPCTGCPVTCMRPVTCCVQQARLVPYVSYRVVYSHPCATMAGHAGPACSGCSPAAPTYGAAPLYAPETTVPYYGPTNSTPATVAPSLPPGSSPATQTFEGGAAPMSDGQLKPIPDLEMETDPAAGGAQTDPASPRLVNPDSRTTRYEVGRAWGFSPTSWSRHAAGRAAPAVHERTVPRVAYPPRAVDDGGWRPSSR